MQNAKLVRNVALGLMLGGSVFAAGHLTAQPTTAQVQEIAQISQLSGARNLADLVEEVSPAVVQVIAKGKIKSNIRQEFRGVPNMPGTPFEEFFERFGRGDRFNGPERDFKREQPSSIGSGFIVESEGIVITNNHVVDDAEYVSVRLNDGREITAKVLGTDPKTDLAVLQIDADEEFETVNWGNSDSTRVGDSVFAVGSPFGLHGSVTSGIVSARGRDIGSGPYDDFIQVDVPINKGNSGGPLFDDEGNVIGVNTAIYSPSGGNVGIGFAIPADMAQGIIADLIEDGSVERGWIGVSVQPVTDDIAESLGLGGTQGALISEVVQDGPSDEAGLRAGDVILKFGDAEIKELRDLPKIVAETKANSDVDVTVWRDGSEEKLELEVAALEEPEQKRASFSSRGDELPTLGLALNDNLEVVDIDPDSESARSGIRVGDKIETVNNVNVDDLDDIRDVIAKAEADERDAVLLRIKNKRGNRFIALPIDRA